MRINRKFKGSKTKDNKGYLKSNEDNFTPFKDIDGGDITMEGVDIPLLAIPMDKTGQPTGMKFMKPGGEYKFGGAANTLEIPTYKKGGKSDWISNKISTLVKEGYPQQQAVAVAYSMYEKKMYGGKMDYMQGGGLTSEDLMRDRQSFIDENRSYEDIDQAILAANGTVPDMYFDNIPDAISSVEGNYGRMDYTLPEQQKIPSGPTEDFTPQVDKLEINPQGVTGVDNIIKADQPTKQANITPEEEIAAKRKIAEQEGQGDSYQFFNPYAGVDIPTAANLFGQGIGKGGDPKLAVAAGAKLALGLGRNIVSGMGRANANDFALEETKDKNRDALLQRDAPIQYIGEDGGKMKGNYQEGGAAEGALVDQEAMLTGNYSAEQEGSEVNVEVEENEYIQTPSGSLTKVLGDNHENGGAKMNLEEGTKIISDHLKLKGPQAKELRKEFDVEVSAKDTYAKAMDKFYKKSGLQDIIDEKTEIIKTIKEQKEKLAQAKGKDESTTNINLEFLSGKLNDLGKLEEPLMSAANMFFDKVYTLQEKSKPAGEGDVEEYQIGGMVYNSDQIISLGKKYNLKPEEAKDMAKKMQNGGIEGKGVAIGDGDLIPLNQSIDPETGLYGNITPAQFLEAQTINNWFDWSNFDVKNPDDVLRFQKEFNKRSTTGAKIKEDGKFGIQTQSVLLPFEDKKGATILPNVSATAAPAKITPTTTPSPTEEPVPGDDSVLPGRGVYLTPGQELLPPTGMVPSTKIERRYGRMDAERFTPDQQLTELNRSVDAAMSQLETLPSGQREAAIVQLQANKQQQTDKIVSDVEKANKQISQQEQAFNIRQSDREVDASAVDTLSFEQRSLGAMANTEDDFRRYFNEGQRRNVEKFKEIESMNFMNALYENFDITPEGIKNTVGSGQTAEDYQNMLRTQLGLAAGQNTTAPTKKARGGRVRYKRK